MFVVNLLPVVGRHIAFRMSHDVIDGNLVAGLSPYRNERVTKPRPIKKTLFRR